MDDTRSCVTCKWASFRKTPTGKIKNASGECMFPIARETLPLPQCVRLELVRCAIWPEYTGCKTWEPIVEDE